MLKNNKAFTLPEIIATITIIILLTVVWHYYGRGFSKGAMTNEGRVFIEKVLAQEKLYRSDNGEFWKPSNSDFVDKVAPLFIDTRTNKYYTGFKIVVNNTNTPLTIIAAGSSVGSITGVYDKTNDNISFTEAIE